MTSTTDGPGSLGIGATDAGAASPGRSPLERSGAGQAGLGSHPRVLEIWPHRSLGRLGMAGVLGFVAAGAGLIVAWCPPAAFWPLTCGTALTTALLALAFWCNTRAARLAETILIGPDVVRVVARRWGEQDRVQDFATYWVRIGLVQDRRIANRLILRERGRSCSIGEFLSPAERQVLAAELMASLEQARGDRGSIPS